MTIVLWFWLSVNCLLFLTINLKKFSLPARIAAVVRMENKTKFQWMKWNIHDHLHFSAADRRNYNCITRCPAFTNGHIDMFDKSRRQQTPSLRLPWPWIKADHSTSSSTNSNNVDFSTEVFKKIKSFFCRRVTENWQAKKIFVVLIFIKYWNGSCRISENIFYLFIHAFIDSKNTNWSTRTLFVSLQMNI